MKRGARLLQLLVAAMLFACIQLVAGSGLAQTTQAERQREASERDLQQRIWNLRVLSIMAAQPRPEKKFDPKRALAQVQEDFTRIQQINKPLGLMALGNSSVDLKFINESATEINKRAERLKENLALPNSAKATLAPLFYDVGYPTQLKLPILDLARLILDFTGNPFFKDAGVVDAQAYKADQDLEAIIELSASVKELSKRLEQESRSDQTPSGQTPSDPEAKRALAALRRQQIPEASLPCSPDEAKWWEEIRATGNKLKNDTYQDDDKFVRLLKEGQEKPYQAPIPNRGPTILRKFPAEYSDEGRKRQISGSLAMVVEFLQDGTVGEVAIVKGLGFGIDEKAAEAARRSIFLPAVKDGKFVSVRLPMTMSFEIR
jgi:hypothetical protein